MTFGVSVVRVHLCLLIKSRGFLLAFQVIITGLGLVGGIVAASSRSRNAESRSLLLLREPRGSRAIGVFLTLSASSIGKRRRDGNVAS